MKLHLVIAVVVCMKVAVANLTSEVGNHGQLVARSGTPIFRNLRSDVVTGFSENINMVFIRHVRQYLKSPAMDMNQFGTGFNWKDVSLFRNPNFIIWLKDLYKKDYNAPELVYDKLKETYGDDIIAMVKTLTVGYIDRREIVHLNVGRVEQQMLRDWKINQKWSLKHVFEKLNLNLIEDETELYGTPVFTFWINYAIKLDGDLWKKHIIQVLAEEENSKNFGGVYEYTQYSVDKSGRSSIEDFYEKLDHILKNSESWHKAKTEQG